MLNVTQKAATEAEANLILQESYNLRRPLGVPTMHIDPANYAPEFLITALTEYGDVREAVIDHIERFLMTDVGLPYDQCLDHLELPEQQKKILDIVNKISSVLNRSSLVAHAFVCEELNYNIVLCPRSPNVAARVMTASLGMKEEFVADMPGNDAEWNFIKLWHEIGHGYFGAREDKADKVSAHVYRYAHENLGPLLALSDVRTAQAVMWYDRDRFSQKYGWPLVRILDKAIQMDAPQSWQQVLKGIKEFDSPNDHRRDTQEIGFRLQAAAETAFQNRDFELLALAADKMIYQGNLSNDTQVRLTQRFSIAAQRLSIGRRAYEADNYRPRYTI